MKPWQPALTMVGLVLPASTATGVDRAHNGIVNLPSHHSVDETVERVKGLLQAKGITLFAIIDHRGEAEQVGMEMPPTKLIIFGSPKGGRL